MVRSMIAHITLPESLWSEALKTVVYLFNRIPSKTVTKTPYKLWNRKSPSIRHLHIRGCPAEARPYILYKKKLDSRTVSCLFVGYSEMYKGFRFYCPSTWNIKTDNTKSFLRIFRTVWVNYIRISHLRKNILLSKWWSSCSTSRWKYSCTFTRYRYNSSCSRSCWWGRTWKFSTISV